MLKYEFIIVVLLFATNAAFANPISEGPNVNITSLDEILHLENGFAVSSAAWSPDGHCLMVTCSKSVSLSTSVHKHYLLDMNSHTFGEIDYGIKELNSYSTPVVEWAPSGKKVYFAVSRFAGPNESGNCYIICNPDGTKLRAFGTNFTDISNITENLGSIGFQRGFNWNSDSSKIAFEWEQPGDLSAGVYSADENGTNSRQLFSALNPQPVWYDSNKIVTTTDEGTIGIINNNGYLTQTFRPENRNKQYYAFSLSQDLKKILLVSGSQGSYDYQTYISNINDSHLKGMVSHYDGDNPDDTRFLTKEFWQPNGSILLVNQKGNLYIVEGDGNKKRLLYKGNATRPQWFPDGKKILFVEKKNNLYSIDVNGTNLTFITKFGLTTSYFWDLLWSSSDKTKQFSISPSGDIIAFTSALYPDTGKIIESEPDPSTRQKVAAPLFIVYSDGSKLVQVTPTIKGRYDTFGEWNPNGKQFTIGSVKFSRSKDMDGGGISLAVTGPLNSTPVWKNETVKKIIGSKVLNDTDSIQNKEPSSDNTANATEFNKSSKQFPNFTFLLIWQQ